MLSAERDFTAATGLKFSLENLQKVKDSFENGLLSLEPKRAKA